MGTLFGDYGDFVRVWSSKSLTKILQKKQLFFCYRDNSPQFRPQIYIRKGAHVYVCSKKLFGDWIRGPFHPETSKMCNFYTFFPDPWTLGYPSVPKYGPQLKICWGMKSLDNFGHLSTSVLPRRVPHYNFEPKKQKDY